jgi:hypothetical protein
VNVADAGLARGFTVAQQHMSTAREHDALTPSKQSKTRTFLHTSLHTMQVCKPQFIVQRIATFLS